MPNKNDAPTQNDESYSSIPKSTMKDAMTIEQAKRKLRAISKSLYEIEDAFRVIELDRPDPVHRVIINNLRKSNACASTVLQVIESS